MKWTVLMPWIGVIFILNNILNNVQAATRWEKANAVNPVRALLAGHACEVYDDSQTIPHVRPVLDVNALASDRALAMVACFGYLHGRDRSWEMDFFRRSAEGKLAEVLGKDSIRSDFFMRLLGLSERALHIFSSMTPTDQNRFWAYSYGVNRGIQEAVEKGVYEFKDLGYDPQVWVPEDSIEVLLLQSFDQTNRTFTTQITENGWLQTHGQSARGLFDPDGLPWDTSILKPGEYPRKKGPSSGSPGQAAVNPPPVDSFASVLTQKGVGEGSNNWVLSPSRSQGGHAWLANDTHMPLKHPPFWHWVQVSDGAEIDAIGASLPGVPAIVSGANHHAGWGLTNSFLPVARLTYVPEAELKLEAVSHRPWIWFKWWRFKLPYFFKTFDRTREGWPVVPIEAATGKKVVLRWTGFDLQAQDLVPLFDLMDSHSAAEVDQVLGRMGLPSWNFVFADDQGKVGYRSVGRITKRETYTDFGIRSRTLDEMRKDFSFAQPLSPDEMPHVMNPARGYIVTANNRQWPSGSRFQAGRAHAKSFRAFRIEELIQKQSKHDLESLQKMQCDLQDVDARFIAPKLLEVWDAVKSNDPTPFDARDAVEALRVWVQKGEFVADLECEACGIYRRWVDRLQDRLNVDLVGLYRKLGGTGYPRDVVALLPVLKQEIVETAIDLEAGMDPAKSTPIRKWADLHFAFFRHLAGDDRFRANPISTPGSGDNVNPGTAKWVPSSASQPRGFYEHTVGPSERLLVEFNSPPVVYSVLAGSNQDIADRDLSAPGSAWQDWVHCRLQRREFPLDWSQVKLKKVEL